MKQRTNRVFVSLKKIEEMAVPENPFANEFLDSFSIFLTAYFFALAFLCVSRFPKV